MNCPALAKRRGRVQATANFAYGSLPTLDGSPSGYALGCKSLSRTSGYALGFCWAGEEPERQEPPLTP